MPDTWDSIEPGDHIRVEVEYPPNTPRRLSEGRVVSKFADHLTVVDIDTCRHGIQRRVYRDDVRTLVRVEATP